MSQEEEEKTLDTTSPLTREEYRAICIVSIALANTLPALLPSPCILSALNAALAVIRADCFEGELETYDGDGIASISADEVLEIAVKRTIVLTVRNAYETELIGPRDAEMAVPGFFNLFPECTQEATKRYRN